MGQLTNYTEKKVLDHILKTASYSPPATVYLGLSTADPTHDGSGWTDPTYTGYARKALTMGAAAARAITQSGAVNFDPCTVGSSTVGRWGLWDNSTGGNLLAYGALSVPEEDCGREHAFGGQRPGVSQFHRWGDLHRLGRHYPGLALSGSVALSAHARQDWPQYLNAGR